MEAFLTVEYRGRSGNVAVDVAVELDPNTSVSLLRDALAEFGSRQGWAAPGPEAPLAVLRDGQAHPLDPDQSVFHAEIVSGNVLRFLEDAGRGLRVPAQSRADGGATQLVLEITSGPSAGRSVAIGPGRYEMGRSPDCDIVVDDPLMSRVHLALEVGPDLGVSVHPRPEATNGTYVGTVLVTSASRLLPEATVLTGNTQFVVRSANFEVVGTRDRLGQIAFNRLPYRRPIVRERMLAEMDPPPERPGRRRFSVLALVLPVLGALAIAVLTKRWEFLLLAGLSPLMMASNFISEGRHSKRSYASDRKEFLQRVEKRASEVDAALEEERQERMAAAPDVLLLRRQAAGRQPRLWERPRGSPDFLELRLGLGEQPTLIKTPLRTGGDPDLRTTAAQRLAHHATLPFVPVSLSLDNVGVSGLYGDPGVVRSLAASLAIQAAVLHSPEDLVIAAAIPAAAEGSWGWLKWLPHTRSATSPLEGPHLVDEVGADDLVLRLLAVVSARAGHREGTRQPLPRVLVVLDQDAPVEGALLARLLDAAQQGGIIVVWAGGQHHQVPRHCQATVACLPSGSQSCLRLTDPSIEDELFDMEGIPAGLATDIARLLAPVRDVSAATATTGIPRVVPLLDVLGVAAPSAAGVAARWARPHGYGLAVTLGMAPSGPFVLDLVQQGPHTLIAGTSGAGKSELLQTLVVALAAEYPPEEVNFLFIDYKGGALSADFAGLPHNVGSVTNLDAARSLRALTSLRAELQRRMAVLEGRAKDLADMLRVAPAEAPPSLVIVVDEFATLVKEIPDFVAGIVDIAQRGRSLGIHLVLATQRPAGAVNDNILANTNLRIALRVLDPSDSSAVIGTRDAAEIPVPLRGRAFARTGPGAVTGFQCAWSGARFEPERQASPVSVTRFPFSPGTRDLGATTTRRAAAPDPGTAPAPEAQTQLAVMVQACIDAAGLAPTGPARRPWVEPLTGALALGDPRLGDEALERACRADPGRYAVLGLGDAPQEQRQFPAVVDLEASGGLIIYGGGGAGKTTALRTIAAGFARQGDSDTVRLFGMDFSGRSLAQIEALPQTMALATVDDLELVARMLTVLRREIDERRRILAAARVEAVSALRRKDPSVAMPRLILLVDSYAGFHGTFENGPLFNWLTEFQRIVSDGRQVGIHVVMTTSRQLGVPSAVTSALGARLVLRMASTEELIGLGVPRDAAQGETLVDGRGFLNGIETQVATVGFQSDGAGQADALSALGEDLASRMSRVERLPELPDVVGLAGVRGKRPPADSTGATAVPLGLADLTLEAAVVDLATRNVVVVGPAKSGRSNALTVLAKGLREGLAGRTPALIGLGGLTSPLARLDLWAAAGFGRSRQGDALRHAASLIQGYEGDQLKVILVIDSAEDLDSIENSAVLDPLLRSDAVRVVATVDAVTLQQAYSGWLAVLKRNRSVLVMQPSGSDEVDAVAGVRPGLRPGQRFPPGRGVLVVGGRPRLVQVALDTPD